MRSLTASRPFFSIKRKARTFARLPRPAPTKFRPLRPKCDIPLRSVRLFFLCYPEQRISSDPCLSVTLGCRACCPFHFTRNSSNFSLLSSSLPLAARRVSCDQDRRSRPTPHEHHRLA